MATTTIHMHQIVNVLIEKRRSIEGCIWRNIAITDAEGRGTTIALFPADITKPEQISIVDKERPE